MNKTTKSTLRVLLLIALLSPLFGCSDSDDGSATTQAQAEPVAEPVTAAPETEAVAPPPEKEAATLAPPMETATVDIEAGVPGGVFTDTLDVSAEVIAVDTENRALTVKGPEGGEMVIKVGPQAVNFDQIQVGDIVKARVIKELVIGMMPAEVEMPAGAGEAVPDGTVGLVAGAAKGAMPAGLVAETTQITATIEAIDMENRTATLSLEDGTTRTVPVRDDIDLSQREVGEKVLFYITEMFAISVEKS